MFSKIGGSPRLTLQIRSEEAITRSVGFVWALAWLAVLTLGLVNIRQVARYGILSLRPFFVAAACASFVMLIACAGPLQLLGGLLFVVWVLCIAWVSAIARGQNRLRRISAMTTR